MKNKFGPLFALVFFICCLLSINSAANAQSNGGAGSLHPPMAEKKPKTTNIHGDTLVDDFFWLREKTSPAVMAHLEAESTYADAMKKPTGNAATPLTVPSLEP